MAAFSFYNFTLDCTINETKSSCYIQAGDYKILVGSLPREAASLSLTAGGTDDYTIVHGIRKDQRWERTGDQSDENGGGPLITLSCPFVFIATFSVTVLSAHFLMKETKREKSHTATDQGGNEKKEGNESRGHYTTIPLMEERPSSLDSGEERPSSLDSGEERPSSLDSGVTTSSSCSLSSSETAMESTKQNQAAQIKEERRTHLYPVSVEACVA
nr:uncharacterized protein LOC113802776 [Penaeus vannamei]